MINSAKHPGFNSTLADEQKQDLFGILFLFIARGGLEAVQKPANTVRKEDAAFVKTGAVKLHQHNISLQIILFCGI